MATCLYGHSYTDGAWCEECLEYDQALMQLCDGRENCFDCPQEPTCPVGTLEPEPDE